MPGPLCRERISQCSKARRPRLEPPGGFVSSVDWMSHCCHNGDRSGGVRLPRLARQPLRQRAERRMHEIFASNRGKE
jgi:hypothetical protein